MTPSDCSSVAAGASGEGAGAPAAVAVVALEESERRLHEICRDLHDDGLQFVTASSLCLDRAARAFAAGDLASGARALQRAREISDRIGALLGDVASRSGSFAFGPNALAGSLRARAAAYADRPLVLRVDDQPRRYPDETEARLCRICGTMLDHLAAAGATTVRVGFGAPQDGVAVTFDSDAAFDPGGDELGLIGMRARLAGGTLMVGQAEAGGRSATVVLPLDPV
jgi:glucose-6-phosphate-specific signal transduction histidine kinase